MTLRISIKVNKCKVCDKTVYPEEGFALDTFWFHGACFKCTVCKGRITPGNYASLKGNYYCKTHFKQLFALKGNYDEGFGRAQHKEKWLPGGKKVREGEDGAEASPAAVSPAPAAAAAASPVSPAPASPAPASPAPAAAPAAAAAEEAKEEPKSPKEEGKRHLAVAVEPASPVEGGAVPADLLSPTVVKFQQENKLKGMPIRLSGLTLEDVEAAQTEFKRINASGSGGITEEEFLVLIEEVMKKQGKVMGKIVLKTTSKAFFQAYDTDKNGVIDEAEFLQIYSDLLLDKEKREKAGEKLADKE